MSATRQVVVCVRDIEPAISTLCKELDTYVTFRDPALMYYGLKNALLPIGDSFLEIVSPITSNVTADRYLNKFGDGGYMIIIQLKDLNELKLIENNANNNNIRIIHRGARTLDMKDIVGKKNLSKSNIGLTEAGLHGIHFHPNDIGCITEMINMNPSNKWLWASNKWETKEEQNKIKNSDIKGFCSVDIAVDNPKQIGLKWIKLLGLNDDNDNDNYNDNDNVFGIKLRDKTKIQFIKKKNEKENGIVGINVYSISTKQKYSKVICGVKFTFVPIVVTRSKL